MGGLLLIVQTQVRRFVKYFLIVCFFLMLFPFDICSYRISICQSQVFPYRGNFPNVDTLVVDSRFHFLIFYEKGGAEAEKRVGRAVKESVVDMARRIGVERIDSVRIFVVLRENRYRELTGSFIPEWSAGFSDIKRKIIAINVKGISQTPYPLRVVVKHELSHILLGERIGQVELPLWFVEGVAMWQASQWSITRNLRFAENFVRGRVPYLKELDYRFPYQSEDAEICYSLSLLAVNYLFGSRADELATLTAFTRDKGDFESAFRITYGITTEEFADRFHNYLAKRYGKFALLLQSIPYFSIIALLLVIAYLIKKYKMRRKLREWEEVDDHV